MSPVEKRKLAYDYLNRRWQILTKSVPRVKQRIVYWGAAQAPLQITLERASHAPSSRHIPLNAHLHFGRGKPVIGPLIGILTASGRNGSFLGVRSNFIDIIQTGYRMGGIVFVFTPEQINWENGTIHAYLYHSRHKQWLRAVVPMPNVVYNRIPLRRLENQDDMRECIHKLQKTKGVTLFNPHFFNKEDLIRLLQRSPHLSPYLPLTTALQNRHDLRQMLRKKKQVFLKPTEGKAGSGIMRVESRPQHNDYHLIVQTGKAPRKLRTKSFEQVWRWFRKYRSSPSYIIQEAVSLTQIDRCPFDFRALVQKDRSGEWQLTGLGIRVAGENRITTHVPRGGRIANPREVLGYMLSEAETDKVQNQVEQLALAIAHELEQHYGHLGEMSMDIGLDTTGKLWFFEANAKPMKFDEPLIRRRSLENLIGYAYYLTFIQSGKGVRYDTLVKAN